MPAGPSPSPAALFCLALVAIDFSLRTTSGAIVAAGVGEDGVLLR